MRNVVQVIAVVAACGPSVAEVKTAKTATYVVSGPELLALALEATAPVYKIGDIDRENLSFITQARFYSPTGDLESPGQGDFVNLQPSSLRVAFVVQVIQTDEHHAAIQVVPKTFQVVNGSPKPRELAPDDPNLPGWVHGRVDSLTIAIYQRAKQYVMAPPGQPAP
jgi:hypothetical protein